MSIEKPPASSASAHSGAASKSAARTDSPALKTKPGAGDAPDAAGGLGFLAILGALDDAAVAEAPLDAAVVDTAVPDTSATASAFDAGLLLQQNPQIAQAAALAGEGAAALAKPDSSAALPSDAVAAAAQKPGAAKGPGQAGLPLADAAPAEPALASHGLQAGARAKPGKDKGQGAGDSSTATATVASTVPAEPRDARLQAALEHARAPQIARGMESVLVPLQARLEKPGERLGQTAKSTEPGYSGSTLGVSTPEFSLNVTPDMALSTDMQVAEQVTYWVSQNVQNAELKLDGLGESAVEVSIQVQGNEAQISFRSDEAATRGVLEGAAAHLKHTLEREGLTLVGVSIGHAGSGGAGGQERRARQDARSNPLGPLLRQATVAVADAGRQRIQGGVAGRSVDLFV